MSRQTTYDFIENALNDIAKDPDSNIPDSVIPHIMALIQRYPDLSIRGTQGQLRNGLETIIDNLHKQGLLK